MSEHEEYMPLLDKSNSKDADCKKKPRLPDKDTPKDSLIDQAPQKQNEQTKR